MLNDPSFGLGGGVTVSAVAPDIVQENLGESNGLQVNLFLHQVTPNAAWRNIDLPSLAADGQTRLRNRPLALDLHYLLTVYGTHDFEAEALMGLAVQFLHETPVLSRGDIATLLSGTLPTGITFGNSSLNALLANTGLADQIEMLKVTPATLGREEMAWLWTALKADYRLTFPFQVSVVLIQAQNTTSAALPVATRGIGVQPGLLASIASVAPPTGQSAACLQDTVTVSGSGLGSAVGVTLSNTYLGIQYPASGAAAIPLAKVTDGSFQFQVPNDPANLPSGVYVVSVQVQPHGISVPLSTNSLPLAIAPKIDPGSLVAVTGPSFDVNPACTPFLQPRQQVSLIIGSQQVLANSFAAATKTPGFSFTGVNPGTYLVRLRVDGIDSPVSYAMPGPPPTPSTPTITVS